MNIINNSPAVIGDCPFPQCKFLEKLYDFALDVTNREVSVLIYERALNVILTNHYPDRMSRNLTRHLRRKLFSRNTHPRYHLIKKLIAAIVRTFDEGFCDSFDEESD